MLHSTQMWNRKCDFSCERRTYKMKKKKEANTKIDTDKNIDVKIQHKIVAHSENKNRCEELLSECNEHE